MMRVKQFCSVAAETVGQSCRVMGEGIAIDGAPEWIQLTPKNTSKGFQARDGRRFIIRDPKTLVDALNASGEHLQIDVDHASEMAGGLFSTATTEAFGWLTLFAVRNRSEIWGKVEWVGNGVELVTSKKFRGISPVFEVTMASAEAFYADPANAPPLEVVGLTSAALTNRPALRLRSLNTENDIMGHDEICKLLSLDPLTTTPAQVREILQSRSVADVVPRSDFEAAHERLRALEAAEAQRVADALLETEARRIAEIDSILDQACAAGKITPSGKMFHRSMCMRGDTAAKEEALAALKEYISNAPVIVAAGAAPTVASAAASTYAPSIRPETLKIIQACGIPRKAFDAAREDMLAKPEVYRALGV